MQKRGKNSNFPHGAQVSQVHEARAGFNAAFCQRSAHNWPMSVLPAYMGLNNQRKAGGKAVMMEVALTEKSQGHSSSLVPN